MEDRITKYLISCSLHRIPTALWRWKELVEREKERYQIIGETRENSLQIHSTCFLAKFTRCRESRFTKYSAILRNAISRIMKVDNPVQYELKFFLPILHNLFLNSRDFSLCKYRIKNKDRNNFAKLSEISFGKKFQNSKICNLIIV